MTFKEIIVRQLGTSVTYALSADVLVLPGYNKGQNQHFQHPHQQLSRKLEVLHLLQAKRMTFTT